MKKYLLLIFIFIAVNILTVSAGEVNIVNSVSEKNYSYFVEHLNEDDTRTTVITGFEIMDQIRLDLSPLQKTTKPFFIKRSDGNKEHIQQIMVNLEPENFKDSMGVLQSFYPSVALYNLGAKYSDSSYYGIAATGKKSNGLEFGINIPAVVHDSSADIGAFYLYYDSALFEDLSIIAGKYISNIQINIISDM
jgi:hypothetical protein